MEPQALIQDVVLKGRIAKANAWGAGTRGGGGSSDVLDDGGPSLPGRFGSVAPLHNLAGQGAATQEREAALVKLGGGWAGRVQPQGSLLVPTDPRSDA